MLKTGELRCTASPRKEPLAVPVDHRGGLPTSACRMRTVANERGSLMVRWHAPRAPTMTPIAGYQVRIAKDAQHGGGRTHPQRRTRHDAPDTPLCALARARDHLFGAGTCDLRQRRLAEPRTVVARNARNHAHRGAGEPEPDQLSLEASDGTRSATLTEGVPGRTAYGSRG